MKTKYKTEWDLAKLFYKNTKDPRIEEDIKKIVTACDNFAKQYKDRTDYMTDEGALFDALTESERLTAEFGSAKPIMYFAYRLAINSADKEAEAAENRLHDILTKAGNKILFFDLNLGKISPENQEKFLRSEKLSHYRYALKKTFEAAKHNLSEPEEKILNYKSLTSHGMWVNGVEKLQNKQTVRFGGKDIPLSEAGEIVSNLPTKKRRELHRLIMEKLRDSVSDFSESEINAVYTDKKVSDELRGFAEPYSATIMSYKNDEKSIFELVQTITGSFSVAHRFYAVKAKLLGEKTLTYADRSAGIGSTKTTFPIEKGIEMVAKIFGEAGPRYKEIFESMLANGQIDIFPRKNKTGGAFCSSGIHSPTLVLLNHADNLRSVETIAHEMGHAVHAEFSKAQSAIYEGHTISVAETASTFFEGLVFEEVWKTLPEKEKIIALHDKIQGDIASIFRQIACFNFELELHRKIRSEGFVAKEDIAKLMNKHMSAYMGKAIKIEDVDGYFFVKWSHIRNFFYVYSYAYGQLISRALLEKYKKDHSYIEKIGQFLSAGCSKSPEDIFKDIGIDTTKGAFFEEGIRGIEKDIAELEKLARQAKKK